MSLTATDIDGSRRLRCLKASKSEICAKDENSEDGRRVRKTFG